MNEQKNGIAKPHQSALTEETVQRYIALQEQKITLDIKQADLALRELDHNQKIADKSIEAQAADRKDERDVLKTMHKHRLNFVAGITFAVLIFALIALWMGKDSIILDILKIVMGFVGGWGASTIWRNQKIDKE